jgi:hypothetical protein
MIAHRSPITTSNYSPPSEYTDQGPNDELTKKMLKMKVAPPCFLKTKGQKKCSHLIDENKRVT